jgi:hypothetical protein
VTRSNRSGAYMPSPRRQVANVRAIRPLTVILLAVAVALVVIGVVFFASSHPLRGGVLVVLAVVSAVGALLSARYR